jgi:hypothetical protein
MERHILVGPWCGGEVCGIARTNMLHVLMLIIHIYASDLSGSISKWTHL